MFMFAFDKLVSGEYALDAYSETSVATGGNICCAIVATEVIIAINNTAICRTYFVFFSALEFLTLFQSLRMYVPIVPMVDRREL